MKNIVFYGKTGVGKTTTINKLFNCAWETDHAIACTKKPQEAILNAEDYFDDFSKKDVKLRIVDLPGIGESLESDNNYHNFYEHWLAKADCLLWLIQADTRAYRRDQITFLKYREKLRKDLSLYICINKADLIGADNFDCNLPSQNPSVEQLINLNEKCIDIYQNFSSLTKDWVNFCKNHIIGYSANNNWRLHEIKNVIRSVLEC